MPIPSVLYDKDGQKIWDIKTSQQNFNKQNVDLVDRDLFLGTSVDFKKFQGLMDKTHPFNCTQPLQIRIMGDLDAVRDASQKILKIYGIPKDNPIKVGAKIAYDADKNQILTLKSGVIGLSKLECEKKERVGHFCSNTIRAYINPLGKGKTTCEKK